MRNLKPFSMKFKDWDLRITRIKKNSYQVGHIETQTYSFKIIAKKPGQRFELDINNFQAKYKHEIEPNLRLHLIKINF